MTTTTTPVAAIAAAAIGYAEMGWPAFPLHPIIAGHCACITRGCTNAGKHPVSTGWQRSLASPDAAASAWRADAPSERGIGIALGQRARVWVLDIDPAHGGREALERLEREHGALPATWEVATGGDGRHLYWAWPPDGGEPIRNRHGVIAPDVDVKGAGGFVVAPPSLHVSGERYRWVARPGECPARAPDWLLEFARAPRAAFARGPDTAPANGGGRELQLRAGERHAELVRFCGLLRSIGLGEAAIVKCGHALLEHHAVDDDAARPIDLAHAERVMRDIARRYRPDRWRS